MTGDGPQPGQTAMERRASRTLRDKFRDKVDSAQEDLNGIIDAGQGALNKVIDGTQEVVDTTLGLAEALKIQIGKVLEGLDVGKLLLLAVRASELTGDQSFLDQWRITSTSA